MRSLVIVGGSLGALVAVAAAMATAPRTGTYKGTTSSVPVNGFNDQVSFTVAPGARQITGFAFGTLGCIGAGGFKPGVNYWLKNLKKFSLLPLTAAEGFSGSGKTKNTSHGFTDTLSYTVKGHFNKAGTVASGTITVSEALTGAKLKVPEKCGPAPMSFRATRT